MDKKWKTSISGIVDGEVHIHGYKITDLINQVNFTDAIWLELKGELPTEKERTMLDAILISTIDNGMGPPSITNARNSASAGNPMQAAVAAGVLGIGEYHGGAIEECARLLQMGLAASKLVEKVISSGDRIPGFGHKVYTEDPRAKQIFEKAKKLGFFREHCELAVAVEQELEKLKGKKIPINVDGAIAAVVSDMGFDYRLGKGFFIIGRVVGLVAHIFEEWVREKPFRRVPNEEIEYDGVSPRKLK
ncbi:citryl-CoA lyase [Candidatus Daviesbacteria bacterium RIFCSPHIGHO2_02_FULL_39_12]|uniref:citrate synthase (unknown stereospecificity) n=2 Tax=Candidatus Daviesiibacteriota TaxID=1752718 RepID=A0A1F5JE68_9BACT|nr:MAG: citryl-CoA lyase [Candidatus Daviesbacteria bacterium RIFCSPHIGHO2_02_FULL_39_12]OGE72096.1 MAG: citryl-CoA lyase [Candidatus Daviesbacteria bacterium RIFCSPLOWO2_02_FULL_38_15]